MIDKWIAEYIGLLIDDSTPRTDDLLIDAGFTDLTGDLLIPSIID